MDKFQAVEFSNKTASNRSSYDSNRCPPAYAADIDFEFYDYSDGDSFPFVDDGLNPNMPQICPNQLHLPEIQEERCVPKRRGRKSKRPELRGKKKEDLDKYWIRRFKAYAKQDTEMLSKVRDRDFWVWFLSPESEPGVAGNQFKSYS